MTSNNSAGRSVALWIALMALWTSGCRPTTAPAAPTATAGVASAEEPHAENGALELRGLRGVSFAPVGEPREEGAWFAAEAVSDPSAETLLTTPVAGIVVGLRINPGANAARGAVVVELRSPELADLEARWRSAEARAERARRDADREQRLLERQATAAREAEAARAEATTAEAEATAARSALEARGVTPGGAGSSYLVRAARSGTVASYSVALGESVAAGTSLGSLVTPGATLVKVELPLPGPAAWSIGAESEARRSDGRRWTARVEGTPPRLAPDSRRLTYFLRLGEDRRGDRPLAGTPLEVRVPLARAIVLPQTALQQIEGVWGVFVRHAEEAEFRPVQKGSELGGDVMVLDGVVPGEFVATDGAYLLKALWLKRAGGGEEHDH